MWVGLALVVDVLVWVCGLCLGEVVFWVDLRFELFVLGFGVCVLDGLIWYNVFWVYVLCLGALGLCWFLGWVFYLLFWF